MKIQTSTVLKAIDGSDLIRSGAGAPPAPLTLGHVCYEALMTGYQDEKGLTGAQKYQRYYLAKKIYTATDEVEMTDIDLALVKKLIGMCYQPIVVGPAYDALTPGAADKIQAVS